MDDDFKIGRVRRVLAVGAILGALSAGTNVVAPGALRASPLTIEGQQVEVVAAGLNWWPVRNFCSLYGSIWWQCKPRLIA